MEPRNRRESGQMLVLFVLALGVLMGFVAMTVDVGMILQERRSLQNTADAAALAGVQELPDSPSAAVAAATEWAKKNGYAADSGATITVNTPYQGNPEAVEVIIKEEVPFLFARVLGLESTGVHARAVATAQPRPGYAIFANADGCVKKGLQMSGSTSTIRGRIHSNNEIVMNSDVFVHGNATHVCDAKLSGDITFTGGISQVSDLVDWPADYRYEDFACTFTSIGDMKIGNNTNEYYVDNDPDTQTLKPGVYCSTGSIDVNPSYATGNVTFVAKDQVKFSCHCDFTPYVNDVVVLSEKDGNEAVSISSSEFNFQGLILAPNGEISPSGSTIFSDSGAFWADIFDVSASDIKITAMPQDEERAVRLVE